MDTFKNIMVALDFSESDKAVIQYAKFLLGVNGIERMDFVHVVPDINVFSNWYFKDSLPVVDFTDTRKMLQDAMRREVEEVFGVFEARMYFEILEGKRLDTILDYAEKNKFDLTIVGRKSAKKGSGILARNLIRKVSSAAMVVPVITKSVDDEDSLVTATQKSILNAAQYGITTTEKQKLVYTHDGDFSIDNILVPVDFSYNSAKSLMTAISLKEQAGDETKINCLHVYNTPDLSSYKIGMTQGQFADMIIENKKEAFKDFMNKFAPEYLDKVSIDFVERLQPNSGSYILDYAHDNNADMIVIGAKGHSKLERFLMGSVTEKLLMLNEKIPTLVVK